MMKSNNSQQSIQKGEISGLEDKPMIADQLAKWKGDIGTIFYQRIAAEYSDLSELLQALEELAKQKAAELWEKGAYIEESLIEQIEKDPNSTQFLVTVAVSRKLMTAEYFVGEFFTQPKADKISFTIKRLAAIAALRQNGMALEVASAELGTDKEIVLEAVRQNAMALEVLSAELKKQLFLENFNDKVRNKLFKTNKIRDFIIELVTSNYAVIDSIPKKFHNDEAIMIQVVSQQGMMLQQFSDKLKKNKNIVLPAVKQNGLALQFAADKLREDKEIVIAAVKQNGSAIEFASKLLKRDQAVLSARTLPPEPQTDKRDSQELAYLASIDILERKLTKAETEVSKPINHHYGPMFGTVASSSATHNEVLHSYDLILESDKTRSPMAAST